MKRRIMLIISIFSVVLILVSTSYALLFKEDKTSKQSYNTGILEISSEALSNSVTLNNSLPMTDSEGENTTPYVFRITNTGNLTYNFNVMLLSTTTENQINSSYIKIKVDDNDVVTLNSLTNGTILENITLKEGEYIDISLRVWLSENTPNSEIGKTFNAKITTEGKAVYTESKALQTLTNLGLSVSEGTPDFSKTSCTSGCGETTVGIYKTQDNLGDTYYFRGDVENNYVYFAGFYWRIIRINGDGTVRMIYDGTEAYANGLLNKNNDISYYDGDVLNSSTFYSTSYNDNAYVGYMYGTPGSLTYSATHSNTYNSTIKTAVDSWYKTNIVDTGYSLYVADAIYCNDRSLMLGDGISVQNTSYGTYGRIYSSSSSITPTLVCKQDNDKFTVNTSLGNGALTYPAGLITADEAIYAGYNYNGYNNKMYLYGGGWFWTMSPFVYDDGAANIVYVSNGSIGDEFVDNWLSVRPVISLKADALNVGSGTSSDPFKNDASKATLTQLGLTSNGPKSSFATVATTDEGIFEAEDDLGTSYYFRGAVENNYVYFANYNWRIIRINGDGSIRMIKETSDGWVEYETGQDNANIGYMYGTTNSSTYVATHTNTNDSKIKAKVDSWYKTNIVNTGYSLYVADAIYCNDRSIDQNAGSLNGYSNYTTLGYGTNKTVYAASARIGENVTEPNPTLLCPQDNDKFTVSKSLGNGDLTYPVGLITADEIVMAGGKMKTTNDNYYLAGNTTWSMTPAYYWGEGTIFVQYYSGSDNDLMAQYLSYKGITYRVVISLKPGVLNAGSGTSSDPFKITS